MRSLSFVTDAKRVEAHTKGSKVAARAEPFGYGAEEAPADVASIRLSLDLHQSEWFHFTRPVVEAMLRKLNQIEKKRGKK